MIKEFTLHPISRKLVHADFIRIDATATIEVRVPFRTTGKSKGEVAGGTILVNVREVKVLCAANAIPVVIEADVTHLQIDDELKIKDLELPAGTELNESPERKLLIVAPPRVAEAEEEVEDENADGDAAAGGADAAAKGDARSTDGTS
jgi:large subunit ribosomal protein L25